MPLLLDACVLINLGACGRIADIANAIDLAAIRQAAEEAGIVHPTSGQPHGNPARLDLAEYVKVIDLDSSEISTFVQLAREVDDGEAATIAAAQQRALPLATDDRRAIRIIRELGLPITVVATTTILRHWAESSGASPAETAGVLLKVRSLARFEPRHDDPNAHWWKSSVEPPGSPRGS